MRILFIILFIFIITYPFALQNARAAEVDELKQKIEDRNVKIQELEEEIEQYHKELESVGKEKQTLESNIKSLDISRQKVSADIGITENRIDSTNLQIEELSIDIDDKEQKIKKNIETIAKTIRMINEIESDSLLEIMLVNNNLSDAWDDLESLQRFQSVIREDLERLIALKEGLKVTKDKSEVKRKDLVNFKSVLSDEKKVLDVNKNEKDYLLDVTKNKESNYQKLLDQKIAARKEFERELSEFESQLQFALDPSRIPPAGKGVLAWPLDSIKITQEFGDTDFARSGAYNGSGHNGVDFRASDGTRVKATLSGTVEAVGNTDLVRGCYSYGKWILLRHNNGLSTLYAHLSVISVSKGENVSTGDIIGYTGRTGYATGPHLHFSTYVSEAVKVVRMGDIKAKTNCADAYIPIAPLNAYLDPLIYL